MWATKRIGYGSHVLLEFLCLRPLVLKIRRGWDEAVVLWIRSGWA